MNNVFKFVLPFLQIFVSYHWASAAQIGQAAPDFLVHTENGQALDLGQFRGRVVYLDFWASWCGPCRKTLPWMSELQERFGSQGLKVIALNEDNDQLAAVRAINDSSAKLSVAFDTNGQVAGQYALPTMPTSFLIDRQGKVRLVHAGFHEGDDKFLEAQIEMLLKE